MRADIGDEEGNERRIVISEEPIVTIEDSDLNGRLDPSVRGIWSPAGDAIWAPVCVRQVREFVL